jgi:hypothetical protein
VAGGYSSRNDDRLVHQASTEKLSADGDPPGPLYDNANIKLQQGMAQLALAYRIIDDRRGFLDIYAGARYNYLASQ